LNHASSNDILFLGPRLWVLRIGGKSSIAVQHHIVIRGDVASQNQGGLCLEPTGARDSAVWLLRLSTFPLGSSNRLEQMECFESAPANSGLIEFLGLNPGLNLRCEILAGRVQSWMLGGLKLGRRIALPG
jgi:hypothetical protein